MRYVRAARACTPWSRNAGRWLPPRRSRSPSRSAERSTRPTLQGSSTATSSRPTSSLAEPGGHSYLCDFGLAKRASTEGVTPDGRLPRHRRLLLAGADRGSPSGRPQRPVLAGMRPLSTASPGGSPTSARATSRCSRHICAIHRRRSPVGHSISVIAPPAATAKDRGDRYGTGAERVRVSQTPPRSGGDTGRETPFRPAVESETRVLRPGRSLLGRRWARSLGPRSRSWQSPPARRPWHPRPPASDGESSADPRGSGPSSTASRTCIEQSEERAKARSAPPSTPRLTAPPGAACGRPADRKRRRQPAEHPAPQLGTLQTPTEQADKTVTLLHRAHCNIRSRPTATIATASLESPPAMANCPLPPNPSFRMAAKSNAEATAAKKRFVAEFKPARRALRPANVVG